MPADAASADFQAWRASRPLDAGYVVVQADRTIARSMRKVRDLVERLGRPAILLPVCRCHGDDEAMFAPIADPWVSAGAWPHPLLLAEIIAHADLVIATSLHACITGLSYGVPTVRVPHSRDRKFDMLAGFEGLARIDRRRDVERVMTRGRGVDVKVAGHQQTSTGVSPARNRLIIVGSLVSDSALTVAPLAVRNVLEACLVPWR